MLENIVNFFKKFGKNEKENSRNTAKERLHLVLAQDRANISADFLEMMKQEIIDVIKKYIDIDEEAIDVRMTNKPGEDGIVGAPALYANIPIVTIKNEARKLEGTIKEEIKSKKEEQFSAESESKQEMEEENNSKEAEKNQQEESVEFENQEKIENDIKKEEEKQAKEPEENEIYPEQGDKKENTERNKYKTLKHTHNKKNKKGKGKRK